MLTFYDSQNQPYALDEQLGRGGEGTVFSLSDDFSVVAKIYHEPIEEDKAEKLRWMARNKDEIQMFMKFYNALVSHPPLI
jgi:DNA-binding helix-hairpin-helix protein with protein kinase domain